MGERRGIVLAGGLGTRLYPATLSVSKQLLTIYDKPMIHYALSVLLLADIREILIISTPHDRPLFERLLGDGSALGVRFSYAEQPRPEGLAQAFVIGEDFLAGRPSCLVLGDNLLYGHSLSRTLSRVSAATEGATIFAYRVSDPTSYGVVEFDASGRVISLEEKPKRPKSPYAIPGLYFYDKRAPEFARSLVPSARGELEITDLNRCYLQEGTLRVETLGRGIAWLDTGTHDALADASAFVRAIEHRQGLKIACLEEIAWSKGWIDRETVLAQARRMGSSAYGDYLRKLVEEDRTPPVWG
ncbi:glucose-1-phosphate thymidylyltransferase [Methylacidimicrobium sp. AP8]|uniref:glucose-1-phosphate thymidylyltransferase RfbA n=1 Tax=Methylacidimicrobium sp. AP8 TaxID=2730359 RepID=UPI0018C06467|nr:glucose-1-phosphate thymidylyltransferase RfbA [Methylacidimicrobium sp. AP8]CAB4242388.1 glucose-1-phosphate thymidylyltransferase [Methylacidimicrobium sp. AP8]